MRKSARILGFAIAPILLLAACDSAGDKMEPVKKQQDEKVAAEEPLPDFESDDIGTAMKERTAVLGFLNKRTGQSRDIELQPGQELRSGKVTIKLRACERTKPWETFPDEGAFVQIDIRQRPAGTNKSERLERVFSGWLFKNNPGANVVQHPIYDIWVKECRMSFPGEEPPRPKPESKKPSNEDQSGEKDSESNDSGASETATT